MNFWGILEFFLIYLGFAGVIVAFVIWVLVHLAQDAEAPYLLGRSVWLCSECHAVYRHKVTHCPAGHVVVEATKQDVPPPVHTYAGYDPYATEILLEAIASEH